MTDVDFGRAADDYARYRVDFPAELFDRLRARGVGVPGQKVLDLGTGAGAMARGFAKQGCKVVGLDVSEELMGKARELDQHAGVAIEYVVGRAEETGQPAAHFDVVSAGQCWHWFARAWAAEEARRVLIPEGWLVIAHFDWLPLPGNVVEATEKLIQRVNPAWDLGGGSGLYPTWLADVAMGGFSDIETFSFDLPVPYDHEGWRGRVRGSSGVAASLSPKEVETFDYELTRLLTTQFPASPLIVPHRVWAVVCRSPAAVA